MKCYKKILWSFGLVLFISALSFLDIKLSAQTDAGGSQVQASTPGAGPAVWAKRLRKFYSQDVNESLGDKSVAVITQMNSSNESAYPELTDFNFICPGDSFLIGAISSYETGPFDRIWRFVCAFLENSKGLLYRKTNCPAEISSYDNEHKSEGESSCDNTSQAFGGIAAKFYPALDYDDRLYKGICCNAANWSNKSLQIKQDTCEDSKTTDFLATINFLCPQDKVMTKLVTSYKGDRQDRSFTFTCCQLELK